jgi:CRP/FNR family cyclic AMP-dependent transcriptional regulator
MKPQEFVRSYRKDEIIFEENSVGDEMYVIHSGSVELITKAPGTDLLLGMLGPGAFFGEMALVDDAPRSATASAAEDNTKLLVLNQSRFLYLVSQQPPFALTIMQGLCQRIRERWDLYSKLSSAS